MPKPRLERREARNQALVRRFTELYELQRMRLDDVYPQLAQEFFLTEGSVVRIIQKTTQLASMHQPSDQTSTPTPIPNTP